MPDNIHAIPSVCLASVLMFACTTDFTTHDAAQDPAIETEHDTFVDTMTDTSPDPMVDTSVTDTTTDVPTDTIEPVPYVDCMNTSNTYVQYPAGLSLDYGCYEVDSCARAGIWIQMLGDQLMVISGSELQAGIWDTHMFAAPVQIDGDLDSAVPVPLAALVPGDGALPELGDASLVANSPSMASLLFPQHSWGSAGETQNLVALNVWLEGGEVAHQYRVFMPVTSATTEEGRLSFARGIRSDWGYYFVFFMLEQEAPLFITNQLYGAAIEEVDFGDPGVLFGLNTGFRPLQTGATSTRFPVTPEIFSEQVILPFMELDMSTDIGSYHVGAWTMVPGDMGVGYRPPAVFFSSTKPYDAAPAVRHLRSSETLAFAALGSDNRFSLSGVNPPYDLNVTQVEDVGVPPHGTGEIPVFDGLMRDMDSFDFLDSMILYDAERQIYHYLALMYVSDGGARVHIYSFHEDGRPAMMGGEPFIFELDSWNPPGFDATIDPATGRIYLASFDGTTDTSGTLYGYNLTELSCDLVTP